MFPLRTALRGAAAACASAALIALAGCSPGGSDNAQVSTQPRVDAVVTDASKLGNVTITEWDAKTAPESLNREQEAINSAFMEKYPNIKVRRRAQSFSDLKTTLKLALSSGKGPDVVFVNQGYGDVAAFVKAHLIRPVDTFAKAYGWAEDVPADILDQNRVSPTGIWGEGNLYGVSSTAELVGVYYNKDLLRRLGMDVPRSLPELEDDLARAKAAGVLPIEFGTSEKFPVIHLFGLILGNVAGAKEVQDLVFGRPGASWTDPGVVKSIQILADWAKKGYIPGDANGVTSSQAGADFQRGSGLFYVSGTWWGGTFKDTPAIGFTAVGPSADEGPIAQGGLTLMWSITSSSKQPEAAAAYIDFATGPEAADIIAKAGNIPTNREGTVRPPAGSLLSDEVSSLNEALNDGALFPYLDYTTTDFYNVICAQLQQLIAGRTSPEDAASALQREAESFHSTLG